MLNILKYLRGLRILPKSGSSEADSAGELEVLISDSKLRYHNGTSTSPIVTEAHTATLTNKTYDANGTGNVLSNIEVENLAADVLNVSGTLEDATDEQIPSALAVKTVTDAITADVQDDVEGPASAVDNSIARFDGVTGKIIQDSGVTINDTGKVGIGIADAVTGLDIRSSDGASSSLRLTRNVAGAGAAGISMYKAEPTTYPLNGRTLGTIFAGSRKEDTNEEAVTGVISFVTTEDHSATALGKEIRFTTTANGSTSSSQRMVIRQDGAVGIGTGTPHDSALLEVSSTTKGFLPPRMTATQMNAISSPATGLLVENTTDGGTYRYNGSAFVALVDETKTQTLTNKTIVAASNTITTAASGNLAATELNAALAELQTDIDTRATTTALNTEITNRTNADTTLQTNIDNHINDASDAHDASAISNTPSGNLAATDIQGAVNELQTDIDTINSTITDFVTGPASATDNAICRFDNSGNVIQNSSVTITDGGLVGIGIASATKAVDIRSTGENGSSVRLTRNSADGGSANLYFYKAEPTTYPLSGRALMTILVGSRKEDTSEEAATTIMNAVSTEAHSATALGKEIRFYTTANGTTGQTQRMTIKQDGAVNIANLTASLPVKTNASKDLVSAAIDLSSSEVTNNLPLSKGGTNKALTAVAGGIVYTDADSMEILGAGTAGQFLTSGGTGAPTWSTLSPGTPSSLSTASGSAPSYSARAWVNFNGTGVVAIRASGNVSSITDNGTGNWTVNFTTAMQDVNYTTVAAEGRSDTAATLGTVTTFDQTVSSVSIVTANTGGTGADSAQTGVVIFR